MSYAGSVAMSKQRNNPVLPGLHSSDTDKGISSLPALERGSPWEAPLRAAPCLPGQMW